MRLKIKSRKVDFDFIRNAIFHASKDNLPASYETSSVCRALLADILIALAVLRTWESGKIYKYLVLVKTSLGDKAPGK